MDADWFSKFAAGLQSIITALGLIVGGAWVLFTFRYLGVAAKSRAELAEFDLRQHAAQEELAERQPNLAIDLTWETAGVAADGKRFISMHAKLRNDGKRPVHFHDATALVSWLSPQSGQPDPDAKPLFLDAKILEADGTLSDPAVRVLRSGQTRTIAFLIPALTPGNYIVQLQAVYGGLVLKKGGFEPSTDPQIAAVEQHVVNVPGKLLNKKSND